MVVGLWEEEYWNNISPITGKSQTTLGMHAQHLLID